MKQEKKLCPAHNHNIYVNTLMDYNYDLLKLYYLVLLYCTGIIMINYKYIYSYHIKYLKTFIHLFDIRITFMKTYSEHFINHIFLMTWRLINYNYYYYTALNMHVYYCLSNCCAFKGQLTVIKRCLRHVV